MPYAEVALNVPARKSFSYHIPDELSGLLRPGSLVRVEFGVAMQPALVLALRAETDIPDTKPVIELLDPEPALSPPYLELAKWLSETCLAPIGACVWLLLPPGFTGKSDRLYRFVRDDPAADQPQQMTLPGADPNAERPLPRRLLEYLRDKGEKRARQLKGAFPKQPLESALEQLEADGLDRVGVGPGATGRPRQNCEAALPQLQRRRHPNIRGEAGQVRQACRPAGADRRAR